MINIKLAWLNIKGKQFKYTIMFLLIFLTSIGLYTGDVLLTSMKKGLEITQDRIGAEVIVVPDGFVSEAEDALFKGKACTLNFNRQWEAILQKTEDVSKVTSQLYLATLSGASCCDGEIQIIAIDLPNDFVVGPWIKENNITNLQDDEIIVGSSFKVKKGDYITYYNRKFKVIAVIDETGAGYDKSAFISYEAANIMASDESNRNTFPFQKNENVTSMIFLRITAGTDPMTVKSNIERQFGDEGIAVYSVTSKINEFSKKVMEFQTFGNIMNVWMILISTIALFAIHTITTFQRKNEVGSMLTVGIVKQRIIHIFLLEYILISVIAIVSAISTINVVMFFFQNEIKNLLELPFILIQMSDSFRIIAKLLGINVLIIIGSVLCSFYWIYMKNPAEMIKEVSR